MTLRKKHLRRIVLALLVVGALAPVGGLALYGLHVRGGAYSVALRAELESRLRCQAQVTGARPTGPSAAAADTVELTWTVGASGRMTLRLTGLTAESNVFGWYVRAAQGELRLGGTNPADVLAALNQRLVQAEHPARLVALTVERLGVDAALPPLRVQSDVRAVALASMTTYAVTFFDIGDFETARDAPTLESDLRPLASLRLNSTSDKGVFDGLRLERKDVALSTLRRALPGGDGKPVAEARGTADLAIDWYWPETDAGAAIVTVAAKKMDLAEWTAALPGGPVTGTADLAVRYEKRGQEPPALQVRLDCGGGTLGGKTLDWLAGLPGLGPLGPAGAGTIPFDRLTVHFLASRDRGWFAGDRDDRGAIPVMTLRLLGTDLPLLRASAAPLRPDGLWQSLRQALDLDPDTSRGEPKN